VADGQQRCSSIARSVPTVHELNAKDRDDLLKLTRQTEGQVQSCRMLISYDQYAIKHYLSFPEQCGRQTPDDDQVTAANNN
jgi:hypothetical protein